MAKKHLILQSDLSTENKVMMLIGCIAQEQKVMLERLLEPVGLSVLQSSILHALDYGPEEGLTVGDLKARMLDDNPNVSRTLNLLVERGLVVKRRSAEDQRVVHVAITEAGRRAHRAGDAAAAAEMGLDLDEAELEQLYGLLARL